MRGAYKSVACAHVTKNLMYPDFLCIGAQKAGTSWLYHALRPHPEVWVPPIKEFHYFDQPTPLPEAALNFHRKRFPKYWRRMREAYKRGDRDTGRFLARYLFLPRTDAWYQSLFEGADGRKVGDMTPSYARMDEVTVAQVATRMPNARIIYILRNPVTRIWSQAKMDLGKRGKLEGQSYGDLVRYFRKHDTVGNTQFLDNLDRWQRHFGSDAIHVDFLEAMADEPRAFLCRVFKHLQLERTDGPFPDNVEEPFNVTTPTPIPGRIGAFLADEYYDLAVAMHERFASAYTARYVEEIAALRR